MGNSSESEVLQWLQDRASGPWCRIERWAGSLGRSLRFAMGVVLGQTSNQQCLRVKVAAAVWGL